MARNDMPDQEMERKLREHFAEEAPDLQAPDDLWDRLEDRLGKQDPPRFALLRGGASAIGSMPWIPAAAAAVLVVGLGVGAWALAGGTGDSGDDDDDDGAVAASSDERVEPVREAATQAAATEAAAVAVEEDTNEATGRPALQEPPPTAEAAAARAVERDTSEEATPETVSTPAPTPEPTPARVQATQPAESETPAPESSEAREPADDAGTDVEQAEEPAEPEDLADEAMDDDMADADMDDMAMDDMGDDMVAEAMEEADAEDSASLSGRGSGPPEVDEPPQRPSDTTFEDYERTAFVSTDVDAVSTFSLDTDRTSYFLALTWVRNGYPVEPDSVRAEEWINAFDYGYAGPGGDDRFAIISDLVRHPLDGEWHLARIAMQAPDVRDDRPLNVTLVLDASGSMSWGDRVAIAREAAETIRQSLSSDDRIAVVHFTTGVIDRYTVKHSSPDNEDVVWSIERLAAHDSTNVQAGLNLGVQLADEARRERPDAYNYIILMSDGVANVDATDPFAILEGAPDTDSRNPLRLITIGVGIDNYNDVLLEQLAQHGNGWYRYLDDTAQARETFSRENWLALSTPFADQARAQVTWDPAVVKEWRIVGYENRITPDHTFTQNRREFAELPAGTATTVFYELVLHEGVSLSAVLGNVEVRWVDPATGDSVSQTASVSGSTDTPFDDADRFLRLGAIVGLAADRYSSLSPQVENAEVDYAGIHADLSALQGRFESLKGPLGSSQAYLDFSSLLDELTAAAAELAPPSGYSQ
ncbi:MAG: von Willebrand factor type A domain-containing protein [Chloroflexota bacterium]|nr:von Willebrand factor type A domain-containing protein [Chloroflexota bacterium]